jgi:hypothetical protein
LHHSDYSTFPRYFIYKTENYKNHFKHATTSCGNPKKNYLLHTVYVVVTSSLFTFAIGVGGLQAERYLEVGEELVLGGKFCGIRSGDIQILGVTYIQVWEPHLVLLQLKNHFKKGN